MTTAEPVDPQTDKGFLSQSDTKHFIVYFDVPPRGSVKERNGSRGTISIQLPFHRAEARDGPSVGAIVLYGRLAVTAA